MWPIVQVSWQGTQVATMTLYVIYSRILQVFHLFSRLEAQIQVKMIESGSTKRRAAIMRCYCAFKVDKLDQQVIFCVDIERNIQSGRATVNG